MKISKSNFCWKFTCACLVILLALSIYLGISGWYFKNDISYTTDLKLGENVQVGIKKNQANSISMNLDGSFLAGERLPQVVSIKNSETDYDLYVRAKVFIYSGDNILMDMDIVETINWTYSINDGYYYFNELLPANNNVALCSYVIVGEDSILNTKTKYIVTFLIESLDSSEDVEQIWGTNPIQNV